MARRSFRDVAVTVTQYVVAIAALAWVLRQVDLTNVWSLLTRLDVPVLVALVAVTVIGLLGRFDTWYVLIDRAGPATYRDAASTDLIVNFVNQVLPSRLSGRVAAPFVLQRRTGMALSDATAITALHTGMYAMCYGVISTVGLFVAVERVSAPIALLLVLSTGLYFVAGGVVLLAGANLTVFDRLLDALGGVLRWLPIVGESLAERATDLDGFTAESTATFREIVVQPRIWLRYAGGWAIMQVGAAGIRVWLLLGAFGASVEPAIFLPLFLVVAYSVTLLPLTPGGIGVTEATATIVFVALGVPGEVAASAIFLDRFLGVYLPALAGWYPSVSLEGLEVTDSS
ncbi:MAG: lysylphosphatidylglycerol synthase transmembrane domain-containing protein [Halorhabdus sp.]